MTTWSRKRKLSLVVHGGFVLIPFLFSTVSAYLFWSALFNSGWLATPIIVVIDGLALAGFAMKIARVDSPFQRLRDLLPFISVVPLGWELYLLLEHNGLALAIALTLIVTSVMITIAWQCFRAIERLFVDPLAAVREQVRERFADLGLRLAELQAMEAEAQVFVEARMRPHSVSPVPPQLPAAVPQAEAASPQADPHASPHGESLEDLKVIAHAMRATTPPASWAAIAARVGRSASTVRGWIEQNGAISHE